MEKIHYKDFLNWSSALKKEDSLLDIGCWSGKTILGLMDKCEVFGMDIDEEKLKNVDSKIKDRIKWGDVTKAIPFKRKFDYILLSEVIEHVSDDEATLENISNSLKRGGKLILSTPHETGFEFWDPAWIKWKLRLGPVHRHYSVEKMKDMMLRHGMEVTEYMVGWNLDFIWKRWINIFLKYVLKVDKRIVVKPADGFFDLGVIARKVK